MKTTGILLFLALASAATALPAAAHATEPEKRACRAHRDLAKDCERLSYSIDAQTRVQVAVIQDSLNGLVRSADREIHKAFDNDSLVRERAKAVQTLKQAHQRADKESVRIQEEARRIEQDIRKDLGNSGEKK